MEEEPLTLQIELQGKEITDIPSFYSQINDLLMGEKDWKLSNSLDAFDDLLYGAYSKWKDYDLLEIIWHDIETSKENLGYQCTLNYYRSKIFPGSPFNISLFKQKIEELKKDKGPSYFDILIEIIESHKERVRLIKM